MEEVGIRAPSGSRTGAQAYGLPATGRGPDMPPRHPHHELNNPVTDEPDLTEYPDPYETRPDPKDRHNPDPADGPQPRTREDPPPRNREALENHARGNDGPVDD